jgi:hypothetical protein
MTPPFCNQPNDTAIMVAQMYAERQKHFVAALSSANGCLTLAGAPPLVIISMGGESSLTTDATILPRPIETAERPIAAEFLLRLCATSIYDESHIGDINERFKQNCSDRGHARACWLYWADTIGFLLRHLPRALKLVALVGLVKRIF